MAACDVDQRTVGVSAFFQAAASAGGLGGPFESTARLFVGEDIYSYAYHNNSLACYDRHLSHPNLGYDFKTCKLGNLNEVEWGGKVFEWGMT